MKNHPTENIIIKEADVDELMIPVVLWLNNFSNTTTYFCCQGSSDKLGICKDKAYVLFTCFDTLELTIILEKFNCYAIVEVSYDRTIPVLRYTARFHNRRSLINFIDII